MIIDYGQTESKFIRLAVRAKEENDLLVNTLKKVI